MEYSRDLLIKAYKLHQALMFKGEMTRKEDPELFALYFDLDVRDILHSIFQPVDKARIFYVNNTLYFVPDTDNDIFAYRNEELREYFGFKGNNQLYFAQFVWINLISEFFGEQFMITGEPRSFMRVDDLLLTVKEQIEKFKKLPEDRLIELSTEHQLDLTALIEVWQGLSEVTDKVKEIRKAHKRDYGFLLKVLGFLEKEKLLIIKDNEEITLTGKMKDIAGTYYHQETRINEIKNLLNEGN